MLCSWFLFLLEVLIMLKFKTNPITDLLHLIITHPISQLNVKSASVSFLPDMYSHVSGSYPRTSWVHCISVSVCWHVFMFACLSSQEASGPLRGIIIVVGKKLSTKQSEYNTMASSLGADYRWAYDSSCTHYIFQVRLDNTQTCRLCFSGPII